MRKCEKKMVDIVNQWIDNARDNTRYNIPFTDKYVTINKNTTVERTSYGVVYIRNYGSLICRINLKTYKGYIRLYDTATTAGRIDALMCGVFDNPLIKSRMHMIYKGDTRYTSIKVHPNINPYAILDKSFAEDDIIVRMHKYRDGTYKYKEVFFKTPNYNVFFDLNTNKIFFGEKLKKTGDNSFEE